MKVYYDIDQGAVVQSRSEDAEILLFSQPNDAERRELLESLHIDRHNLDSALDPEELSRIELATDHVDIIWKRPSSLTVGQKLQFQVSSVGLFLQGKRLVIVLAGGDLDFSARAFQQIASLNDFILKFLLHTVYHYLEHLKVIKQLTSSLQAKLNTSMENRYFLQMFDLSESLVYYLNAMEGNASVLSKLRASGEKIGFSEQELLVVDDILIEQQQCARQTQIFSTVLAGLMDARGNIINNNMNVLLKNLTLINVVFLPLNLIASIGGMSEFSRITAGVDWKLSYFLLGLAMVGLGWITWRLLVSRMGKR